MPSLESLSIQVQEHDEQIGKLWKCVDEKVTIERFNWVFGIAVALLLTVFGYLSVQMKELDVKISEINKTSVMTQVDVASLKGTLSNYDIKVTK